MGAMQELSPTLHEFAARYTAAWCSQDAGQVASFFASDGSLSINDGNPSIGHRAIADAAQSFMTAFPDLRVMMDGLVSAGERVEYHWTLTGTHSGLGGTGRSVRLRGYESWLLGADGLIRDSQGHFDADDYKRQLTGTPPENNGTGEG